MGVVFNPLTSQLDFTGSAGGGGLSDVVDDVTPQLGGDLDVNGMSITSAANGDVTITTDGTGKIYFGTQVGVNQMVGDLQFDDTYGFSFKNDTDTFIMTTDSANFFDGEIIMRRATGTDVVINFPKGFQIYSNTEIDGSGSTYAPWIVASTSERLDVSAGAGGLDLQTVSGSNGDVTIAPNGTGRAIIHGLTYPNADGTDGQVLTTDGMGNIAFESVAAGAAETFESVSKNIKSWNATYAYTVDTLTSISYTDGVSTIVKTLNYTGVQLTSLVLSGDTPGGIDLTKTLTYTGTKLTGASYT